MLDTSPNLLHSNEPVKMWGCVLDWILVLLIEICVRNRM